MNTIVKTDDDYDWRDDAKKCYELAIKVKRERGDKYWPERESDKMA